MVKAIFATLAVTFGVAIIGWVLYNELIERQPQYQRSWIGIFGVAPAMLAVGLNWFREIVATLRSSRPPSHGI